jgi:hypothetical protein
VKLKVFLKLFFITSAAPSTTNAVESDVKVKKTQSFEKSYYHFHKLYIYPRTPLPYCFYPYLMKLSQPAPLGSLIPEHRPHVIYPPQVLFRIQFVLNISSYNGCGGFRTKR